MHSCVSHKCAFSEKLSQIPMKRSYNEPQAEIP